LRTVLLRLEGPMQSWGTQSRFKERDTDTEPSKSGVVGLVCAALGVARGDVVRIQRVATLGMAVRVDREGTVLRDYHTAGGGTWPGRKEYGVMGSDGKLAGTVLSNRYYLADASFLVGIGSNDLSLLDEVARALMDPVFPLALGRRAFVPSMPVLVPGGPVDGGPDDVVRRHPWSRPAKDVPERLRLVLETSSDDGVPRQDVPLTFDSIDRSYARRFIRIDWISTVDLPPPPALVSEDSCTYPASC
jgi:CRISPR system Cascade subunit CasD